MLAQGLHGFLAPHGLQGFFALQGLHGLQALAWQGFLLAQGLHGFLAPHGLQGLQGLLSAAVKRRGTSQPATVATLPPPHGLHGLAPQGLQGFLAPHGLHGLQALALHGLQGFFAPQGLHGFLAPQGLQGFLAPHGLQGIFAAHGFLAAQGLALHAACAGSGATAIAAVTAPTPSISGMTVVDKSLLLKEFIVQCSPRSDSKKGLSYKQ